MVAVTAACVGAIAIGAGVMARDDDEGAGKRSAPDVTHAHEAQWIWSPDHTKDNVPQTACHFRKVIDGPEPEAGRIEITADDSYELYINGRLIGRGSSTRQLDEYDITRFLSRTGANTVAIRVVNERGRTAALAARVTIKDMDGPWRSYSTDASWRTNLHPLPLWNSPVYNDRRWAVAQEFGKLGETAPWDRKDEVPAEEKEKSERFQVADEFEVRRIAENESTGSLIAFTFNEFGHIIASRENGPLLLIHEGAKKENWSSVRTYCDKVKNCQGLLSLNGDVYATGDGPDGQALYRLSDRDRDGVLEQTKTLVKFTGPMGEHGAHGITLGPDGFLYVMLGNHTAMDGEYAESSPLRHSYEGDLVPRYEDPGGHAVGIKAPGGTIVRTDLDGRKVELVAGGIRNAYDLAFNREGDLFFHDSDMESDIGAPWYRPTQVYHAVSGGEYGWRSGWATWPEYWIDGLPGFLDTGRGSPAGAVVYDHFMFPKRYQNGLFLADWSQGRILAVQLKNNGATYTASSEVFIQGSPLNVTDLEVGPEGALYFITGGRGTSGGIYRVTWKGSVPAAVQNLGQGVSRVIRHPQLNSAWARQAIARTKEELGGQWGRSLNGVARSSANPPQYRTRALDLMQLFGPPPARDLLVELSRDNSELVRAKAAELMGLHANDETHEALIDLLDDTDRGVRRRACEALRRANQSAPAAEVLELVKSDDRFEAWSARRLLEQMPTDSWRDDALTSEDHRAFIQGALALLIAHPDHDTALEVLTRIEQFMSGFVSDRDFIDMLRLVELALLRSEMTPDESAGLAKQLGGEFPAGNDAMNRELVRLLAHLQVSDPLDRYMQFLDSDAPLTEKLHLAFHLRFLEHGWRPDQKMRLFSFYEDAQQQEGGGSYPFYLRFAARDFAKSLTAEESLQVLERGEEWPSAALGALYSLPETIEPDLRDKLIQLDRRLIHQDGEHVKALRVGLIATLARIGDEPCLEHLRDMWDKEPERRGVIAIGLAQHPDGDNWSYLVRTIPVADGAALRDLLAKLLDVPKAPAEPEFIRQTILAGLRLKDGGADDAVALLEYWTGESLGQPEDGWETRLTAWRTWFGETYPNLPEAALPEPAKNAKWKEDELYAYLGSEDASKSSIDRGATVFAKAQCAKCHRFGDRGEIGGPDLTTLSNRFTRKETLESILFPSHTISDQYASKTVTTTKGKTYVGLVTPSGDSVSILQPNGTKIELKSSEIEETSPSRTSAMPDGLLDTLSLDEIGDLFSYLGYRPPAKVARRTDGVVK